MKRAGRALLFIGLFIGILLAVGLLGAQRYLSSELVDIVRDEVIKSCPECDFKVDQMTVSLVTLSAKADNVRITIDDAEKLQFDRLTLSFDIKNLRKKELIISRIDLIDGTATGVDADSAMFKFIDHLSTPSPTKSKNALKITLKELRVKNSKIREDLGGGLMLHADGLNVALNRAADDSFVLQPTIDSLSVVGKNTNELGNYSATVNLLPGKVHYPELIGKHKNSQIRFTGQSSSPGNILDAAIGLDIKTKDFGLGLLDLHAKSKAKVSGTYSDPVIKGNFVEKNPAVIRLNDIEIMPITSATGGYEIKRVAKKFLVAITNLNLHNENGQITLKEAIEISEGKIKGKLDINIGEVNYNDIILKNINGVLSLSGEVDRPNFSVKGNSEQALYAGQTFNNTDFNVDRTGDTLRATINHHQSETGSMNIATQIKLKEEGQNYIQKLDFDFHEYAFQPENIDYLQEVRLSGSGSLQGELSPDKLNGQGNLKLSSRFFAGESALQGQFQFLNGQLTADLANPSSSLATSLTYDFKKSKSGKASGSLQISLKDLHLREYNPELECIELSLDSDYKFNIQSISEGNGNVQLQKLKLGCAPYDLNLAHVEDIAINSGRINDLNVTLEGLDSELLVSGVIDPQSGIDLTSAAHVNLKTFITFLPYLDDLRGDLQSEFNLSGPFDDLKLTGAATLSKAEFAMAEADLSGENFAGNLNFAEEKIIIENLNGLLNTAPLNITGTINPFNLKEADLALSYEELSIEPSERLLLTSRGKFKLSPGKTGKLSLTGDVEVTDAVFRQELGLNAAIKLIRDAIFADSKVAQTEQELPDIDLGVKIIAKRNIFVLSNLLESELKADINIAGNLQTPIITGELESLYGWFGLSNSKFNITSAIIGFTPHSSEPDLDLIAETNVVNRLGETTNIVLEASGKVTSPRVSFIADSNLNEQEILTLLTTRGAYRVQTQAGSYLAQRLEQNNLDTENQGIFSELLSGLTDIDSITIEPAYNNGSGLIEPSLVARKDLNSNLYLTSESFFGGSNNDSRFRANYNLTPFITVSGIVDTITTQENTAFGFDTSFTILAKRKANLAIELIGNNEIDQSELEQALRINRQSSIEAESLSLLKKDLNRWLKQNGYLKANADLSCEAEAELCRKLIMEVTAGEPAKISKIIWSKDTLPKDVKYDMRELSEKVASYKLQESIRKGILRSLRSEGYLEARIQSHYQDNDDEVSLVLNLRVGNPVSFTFKGNKIFTAEELLKSINIFERSQPFGNNTINILIQSIEKMYREKNYLFASIDFEKLNLPETNRTNYLITIKEEVPINTLVSRITGLNDQKLTTLTASLINKEEVMYEQIFEPKNALAEQLESNAFFLKNHLSELGHPDAKVNYQLNPKDNGEELEIIYTVDLGKEITFAQLTLEDFPDDADIEIPKLPAKPYSIPKINRYIDVLLDSLNKYGFQEPLAITIPEGRELKITASVANRTKIADISCLGNEEITCESIIATSGLESGSGYSRFKLNEARVRLLKLGLYQLVNIELADNNLDEEDESIVIKVTERPLQTFDLGVGINSELGLHVFGEAKDLGLFKDGRVLSLRLDSYYNDTQAEISQGIASLRFQNPSIFDTGIKFTNDLGFQKYDNPTLEFDLNRVIYDLSIQQSWSNGVGATLGYSFLNEDLDNVTPGAILSDFDTGNLQLSYLYGSLAYDQRDDPLSPSKGTFLGLDYKLALDTLASDASFYSLSGRFAWILPLSDSRFSLANNTAAGASWSFKDSEDIPITQRFYTGGRNTIRGFRQNSLGPQGEDGAILGGDMIFGNNFELRYKVNPSVGVHGFYDVGSVFLRDESTDFDQLRESAGLGVRYISPIGPIGVDIGHPLDEEPGEPSLRLHFSVGSVF